MIWLALSATEATARWAMAAVGARPLWPKDWQERAEPTVEGGENMPLKIFAVLALCLAMTAPGLTATVVDMQLIRAAFFSDACRQQAEALGIARTPDANALVAAFAGLKRRPANSRAAERQQRDDCTVPAVELINLLRLNGIDAEPLFRYCATARRAKPRRSA